MGNKGNVATALLKDNMGSSTVYTKRGEETVSFFSQPAASEKPELAEDLLSWLCGSFLLTAVKIAG